MPQRSEAEATETEATETEATETKATALIPVSVTVEIAGRSRSRRRRSESVRLALTYRLEGETNSRDETQLSRLLRRSMRTTLRAVRLARTPVEGRGCEAPIREPVTVQVSSIAPDAMAEADLSIAKEVGSDETPTPRRRTGTQLKTLEIMARQLGLEGQGLTDLLGVRLNRASLDSLTYREAAGLIAHFSGLLRQRLQQERDDQQNEPQAAKSNLKGGHNS